MTVDFSAQAEVEAALSALALAAFDQALGGAPRDAGIAALAPMLAEPSDLDHATRVAGRRARRHFLMNEPEEWTLYQARVLAKAAAAPWPAVALSRALAWLRRSGANGAAELQSMRAASAASAWSGMTFRLEVARRLRRHLSGQVLMSPGPVVAPVLSDPFWWMLIGLFERDARMGPRLRRLADEAAEAPGWAGFWEQFLLVRAIASGATPPGVVRGLPLVERGTAALSDRAAPGRESRAVRHGWRAEAPGWAHALLTQTI